MIAVTDFEEDAEPDLALADRQRRCHLNALLGCNSGENKIDNYKKGGGGVIIGRDISKHPLSILKLHSWLTHQYKHTNSVLLSFWKLDRALIFGF